MKKIPLSQGKFTTVDDETFEELSKYKWSFVQGYAKRSRKNEEGKWRLIPMHRAIMGLDDVDKRVVDHINGNRLDNRVSNLRVCTRQENTRNHGPKNRLGKATSKYKGVSYKKDMHKWRARITLDRSEFVIGYFETEDEAALAYNEAAIKLHGEFAWLNDV